VAKRGKDKAFRQRLLADPAETLREEGVEAQEGLTVRVVQDTVQVRHLVIPAAPGRPEDAGSTTTGSTPSTLFVCGASCSGTGTWTTCMRRSSG